MNLNEMTARELAAALKNREVSAIDVTENALERAKQIFLLNIFTSIFLLQNVFFILSPHSSLLL